MLRVSRWAFGLIGALLLWRAGISIFRTPAHEVLFSAAAPMRTCLASVCTNLLVMQVGNTGSEPQENVRVRFRAVPLQASPLPMTVRNFGIVDRPVKMTEAAGERVYDLGRLEPQKRVEFKLLFVGKPGESLPSWDDLLVGVEPASGEARLGDPAVVRFARMMQALFGWM
jgi:hypothetical protein